MARIIGLFINLLICAVSMAQIVVIPRGKHGGNPPDEASVTTKFALRLNTTTISGWVVCFLPSGQDQRNSLSWTDATTGVSLTTVGANWYPFAGGFPGSNGDGMSTGTFGSDFPSSVVQGNWYNADGGGSSALFNGSNYNMIINRTGGFLAGNYRVKIIGSIRTAVNGGFGAPVPFQAKFGTGSNQAQGLIVQDNTQNIITFTGSLTSGQTIQLHVGRASDNNPGVGVISGIIIEKI